MQGILRRADESLDRELSQLTAASALDIENLEEEGLSPGKVLIYRQGANPPKMLTTDTML